MEFGANGNAIVSWKPVTDPLEPTAVPTGYIIYKRIGEGAFDCGTRVHGSTTCDNFFRLEVEIPEGEVVSFKVVAYNDGGKSFPSEIVSIGKPHTRSEDELYQDVLVVNNFDRISGPVTFDDKERAGFENNIDSGVPDEYDITFIGEMYNFQKDDEWKSNDSPGFGASHSHLAGEIVAGNTFDYAATHGKAILEAGHAFYSCSNERFVADSLISLNAWSLDLICGKQRTTKIGHQTKYQIFSTDIQDAIKRVTNKGCNLIVSGANIAGDAVDDKEQIEFVTQILGYKLGSTNASKTGIAKPYRYGKQFPTVNIVMTQNPDIYCVEALDGIFPSNKSAKSIYRYADSGISAAIIYLGTGYKTACFGFPIEAQTAPEAITNLIINSLEYFKK